MRRGVAQGFSPASPAALTSLRQGYGGPPKRSAKAEGLRYTSNTATTGPWSLVPTSRWIVQLLTLA